MAKVLRLLNGIPRSLTVAVSDLYDQTSVVGGGGVSSGTAITLPSSGTYTDQEMLVLLNDVIQEVTLDYNYVGSVPRTQISFTFDLVSGDRVRFKKLISQS